MKVVLNNIMGGCGKTNLMLNLNSDIEKCIAANPLSAFFLAKNLDKKICLDDFFASNKFSKDRQ